VEVQVGADGVAGTLAMGLLLRRLWVSYDVGERTDVAMFDCGLSVLTTAMAQIAAGLL
jgi:hypothetical protein